MRLIIFLIGFPLALLMIMYRKQIIDFTGKFGWAEEKIGPGGSYTLIIIIALVIWMGCLMYSLGSFDLVFGFLTKFF